MSEHKPPRLRIESDGTAYGTRVFTPEGEDITNCVVVITWTLRAGSKGAGVTIEFVPPEIIAHGDLQSAEVSRELLERLRAESEAGKRQGEQVQILQRTRRDLSGSFRP